MSPPAADPSPREQVLERAKAYPYRAPAGSFLLVEDHVLELEVPARAGPGDGLRGALAREPGGGAERSLVDLDPRLGHERLRDRLRLLAYGSNRSPEALTRKRTLPGFPADEPIVALHARLRDFDVVYSAHLSAYGSVAATIQRSPGTVAEVSVLLVTPAQLSAITGTETRNYTLEELVGLDLELDGGARLERALTYVSRHGCVRVDGSERALAAVPATGRRIPSLSEPEALAVAAARLGHAGALDDFILATAADPAPAGERTRELRRDARPLAWPYRLALEEGAAEDDGRPDRRDRSTAL